MKECSVDVCDRPVKGRGWCGKHYRRWQRHGTVEKPTHVDRFWSHVDMSGDCWLWTAKTDKDGYGIFSLNNTSAKAHRFSYEVLVGEIPVGRSIDHRFTCPKNCVRPVHLRVATPKQQQENLSGARSNSGVRGVSWIKANMKWKVTVGHLGKYHYGGYFDDLAEAEAAAIALRNSLFTYNDMDRMVS